MNQDQPMPNSPKGSPVKRAFDEPLKRGYPRERVITAALDALAWNAARSIGADEASQVHQAMKHLVRKTWELSKEFLAEAPEKSQS